MAYAPPIKVYYAPVGSETDESFRLVPAPLINISTVPNYVNDNIVGYDYIVTLNGTITALDLRTEVVESNIEALTARIQEFSDILHYNGGVLSVFGSSSIIKAKGGILQSFSVDTSSNRWVNYAPFTAEFKFNEIDFNGCENSDTVACNEAIYASGDYNSSLIDITKYKIASFADEWTFDINESAYNRYSSFHNESINIEYTISANGKLFFNGDKLLPAWEQAKNFCQDRLYKQVTNLIRGILPISNDEGCSPSDSIDTIHSLPASDGMINLDDETYGIYNETITCNTSESAGSFSATYNAILKKQNSSAFSTDDAIHTFTVERRVIDNNATKSIILSVNGEIQGLIPGGLINQSCPLELPSSGKLLLVNDTSCDKSKYDAALANYNLISNGKDLTNAFKSELQITYFSLGLDCNPTEYPNSTIFNIDHTYADGRINYNAEYNSVIACLDKTPIRSISITKNDPTPRIAEFIVPGRSGGPIIQRIGSDQPATVSVNINGVNNNPYCCLDPEQIVQDICGGIHSLVPSGVPDAEIVSLILTEDSYSSNLVDGSFTIKREYICCNS